MIIEIIVYPFLLAIPGITWIVFQFIKSQETDAKKLWLQRTKLIFSILLIIVFSGVALFLGFGVLLGPTPTGDLVTLYGTLISIYIAAGFLFGQWIKSTRLGNVSASIGFAVVFIYFSFIKPIIIIEPLANINIANAQYMMGVFYESGIGGALKHKQSAWQWYSKAGKQGHIRAARAAVRLLPTKNYDRITLLKILAADEPDGDLYYSLYESTYFMPYSSDIEKENDADKWLILSADFGSRDGIMGAMGKKYPLERSCRLSPNSYDALPQYEKWVSAYEKNRWKSNFDKKELHAFKERVACLAEKVAEAKIQDAQLGQLRKDLFSSEFMTQVNALATVKKMGPRAISAIPDLLRLAHIRNSSIAWNALGTIKKIDPEGEVVKERILTMLKHGAAHVRENGIYGVALYAEVLPNAIPLLDKLLADPDNLVAGRAALALSEYGNEASSSLDKIQALHIRRDSRLSSYAHQAYSKIKPVVTIYGSPNPQTRKH